MANITTYAHAPITNCRNQSKSPTIERVFDNGKYAEYNLPRKMGTFKSPRIVDKSKLPEMIERANRDFNGGGKQDSNINQNELTLIHRHV